MDQDRANGSATNLGGKLKEGAGDLTGDKKLKNEGILDQVMGKVRNIVGGIKDAIKGKRGTTLDRRLGRLRWETGWF